VDHRAVIAWERIMREIDACGNCVKWRVANGRVRFFLCGDKRHLAGRSDLESIDAYGDLPMPSM
jgi:hypothetical protein